MIARAVGFAAIGPLELLAAFCALAAVLLAALFVVRVASRRSLRIAFARTRERWDQLARERGFEVELGERGLVMRGTVAERPFVIDEGNFLGYGLDAEVCMHVEVGDDEAAFCASTWYSNGTPGEPVLEGELKVSANDAGRRVLERLGPEGRRLLLERDELAVLQARESGLVRLPYTLDGEHLDAACRIVELLWGMDATRK